MIFDIGFMVFMNAGDIVSMCFLKHGVIWDERVQELLLVLSDLWSYFCEWYVFVQKGFDLLAVGV